MSRLKPSHIYGPFSYQVASALDEMVAFSYLSEQVSSGYNYESYHYELTESGKNYATNTKTKFSDQFNIINSIVETCNKHCKLQSSHLSYSAKAHYILVNGGKNQYRIEDVQETAKKFDWKISRDDAESGINLLKKLNLVHDA